MNSIVDETYDSDASNDIEQGYSVLYSDDDEGEFYADGDDDDDLSPGDDDIDSYRSSGGQPSNGEPRKKRVRRRTVAPEVKKDNHKERERARRNLIKDRFAYLRDTVPSLGENTAKLPRTEILERVIEYIQHMRNRNQSHMMEIENLRQGNVNLEEQSKGLHNALRMGFKLGAYVEPSTGEVIVDGILEHPISRSQDNSRCNSVSLSADQQQSLMPSVSCSSNPGNNALVLQQVNAPELSADIYSSYSTDAIQLPPINETAPEKHFASAQSVRSPQPVCVSIEVKTRDEQQLALAADYDSPEEEFIALSELKPEAEVTKKRSRGAPASTPRRSRGGNSSANASTLNATSNTAVPSRPKRARSSRSGSTAK